MRAVLADHPDERTISLLAISVSHLEEHADLQLELPLGLEDERRRPGTRAGHGASDGRPCRRSGSAIVLDGMQLDTDPRWISRDPFPDEFRELAEEDAKSGTE